MTPLHKWGAKKVIGALSLLGIVYLLSGCASLATRPEPHEILSCSTPEGYEYYCYNDAQCREYLKGYAAVVRERFYAQKHGFFVQDNDPVQVVHINLFFNHLSFSVVGRIEAELNPNQTVHIKVWTIACDLEQNIVEEGYDEYDTEWRVQ